MIWDDIDRELAALAGNGLTRRRRTLDSPCAPRAQVDGQPLLGFASNDYLGLATHPALIAALQEGAARWGAGSGASHLVSGHLRPHQDAEACLADYVGLPRALTFSTGYLANLAIVPALVGRGDAVFADRLNHASLIDAVQLSRADHVRYPHGDLDALAARLAASRARRKLILTDGVFSMDGDVAPLAGLFELAERHDAWLVVDDAHGFGVLGPAGRGSLAAAGLPASRRILLMGTLGKAAGLSGAFVAGDAAVIEWLLQRARSYIFTTAAPPAIACAICRSVELLAAADERRARLSARIAELATGLAGLPWPLLPSPTAIQPLVVGDNFATLALADGLLAAGLWVPAIRPPTVPQGSARLRISLSAAHTADEVAALCSALARLAGQEPAR